MNCHPNRTARSRAPSLRCRSRQRNLNIESCESVAPMRLRHCEWVHALERPRSARNQVGGRVRRRDSAAPRLVAGEEAGPGAHGQHAQVPPRADAALARPRPAPIGRCKQSIGSAQMHKHPARPRIEHFRLRCTAEHPLQGPAFVVQYLGFHGARYGAPLAGQENSPGCNPGNAFNPRFTAPQQYSCRSPFRRGQGPSGS